VPESPDLNERAHRNLCDFTRFLARLEPGGKLVDADGIVAIIGDADFPTARTAVRTNTSLPGAAWAERVAALLAAHGNTGNVFARVGTDDDITEALAAPGYREWAQTPEMICEHALEPREPPAGVTVRFARTPADVAAYASIAGRAFTHLAIPEATTHDTINNPDVMLGDDCVIALADLDDVPVAGALVVVFAGAAGGAGDGYVGWVACVDEARGRGLGDTVTRAVTNEAFARGAGIVTLEASQFGEHTYARMGYREAYRYRILIKI
jgi:ribosomal protein S18 acetylase RimI-like enzyme